MQPNTSSTSCHGEYPVVSDTAAVVGKDVDAVDAVVFTADPDPDAPLSAEYSRRLFQ